MGAESVAITQWRHTVAVPELTDKGGHWQGRPRQGVRGQRENKGIWPQKTWPRVEGEGGHGGTTRRGGVGEWVRVKGREIQDRGVQPAVTSMREEVFVCCRVLVGESKVYLRDQSAQTAVCAALLR